jgi:hypothetical protein
MSQHVERFAAAASGLARAERDGRRGRFLSPGRRPHEGGRKVKAASHFGRAAEANPIRELVV